MASPGASSATLSIHSDDDHVSYHGEAPLQAEGEALDSSTSPVWDNVDGILYDKDKNFILTEDYLRPTDQHTVSPAIRAAGHFNPLVLQAVLMDGNDIFSGRMRDEIRQRRCVNGIPMELPGNLGLNSPQIPCLDSEFSSNSHRVSSKIGITSPLLEAIRHELPENVTKILGWVANPDGVPFYVMENYAVFFLRFRPRIPRCPDEVGDLASRQRFLDLMDQSQISNLTLEEIEDRFDDGMAPFWCEEGFTPKDFFPHGDSIPSLVAAAKCGRTEIFDLLLRFGADDSFWLLPHNNLPQHPTMSSLSVSSPLHAAIESDNVNMVDHLLKLLFNPNVLPLANPTRCYTPLMATVMMPHFNRKIFDLIISHPQTKPEIRTPVYDVHILHFAVARLHLPILQYLVLNGIPLASARSTDLGHTLLHVACMPADALHVQRRAELVYRSIHETRDLRSFNDPHAQYPLEFNAPISCFEQHFEAQTKVVKYLWENGIRDFYRQDVHGNTALHYLAGCQSMNWDLLYWLFDQTGGENIAQIWRDCENDVGATPEQLASVAKKVRSEKMSGWCDWFERRNSKARVEKKERIWKGLLAGEEARRWY